MYKIIRKTVKTGKECTIKKDLTKQQAQAHCASQRPDTLSRYIDRMERQ